MANKEFQESLDDLYTRANNINREFYSTKRMEGKTLIKYLDYINQNNLITLQYGSEDSYSGSSNLRKVAFKLHGKEFNLTSPSNVTLLQLLAKKIMLNIDNYKENEKVRKNILNIKNSYENELNALIDNLKTKLPTNSYVKIIEENNYYYIFIT